MNYFKEGEDILAFTDEQLHLVSESMLRLTEEEILPIITPKPSQFHTWDGSDWVDNRTEQQILDYERSLLPALPKRQFALYLFDHQLYDQVMSTLDQNPRFKIEYETVKDLERMSPTVSAMTELLEWTDNQVDEMWRQALEL